MIEIFLISSATEIDLKQSCFRIDLFSFLFNSTDCLFFGGYRRLIL